MKFLILIVIVVAVIWYVRSSGRTRTPRSSGRASASPPPPQDMIECPVCLVHLPRTDALAGPDGRLYCCAEHLRAAR